MAEEGFHDYTLATKLERLVAQLEQCFRGWMLTGLENISHMQPAVGADREPLSVVRVSNTLEHRMPWRSQPYILTLHVPYTREAELQAARQRQQQQQALQQQAQQQQQQQAQQQQRPPLAASTHKQQQPSSGKRGHVHAAAPPPTAAPPAAAAAADMQHAVNAASKVLAQRVAASAFAGGPAAVEKLQAQLAPLVSSGSAAGAEAGPPAAAAAAAGNNDTQLQQQVQELIEQYHQVHLQLQADAEHEQQEQPDDGHAGTHAAAAASDQAGSPIGQAVVERSTGSSSSLAAAAAAAAVDVLSGLRLPGLGTASRGSSTGGGGGGGRRVSSGDAAAAAGSPAAAAGEGMLGASDATRDSSSGSTKAAARGGGGRGRQLNARRLARPSDGSRAASSSGSGSGASAASGGLPSASGPAAACLEEAAAGGDEEGGDDEASSRRVELPAADELVAAGSSAMAAVRAAVQQDQSRSSASRTWWPLCFDASLIRQLQQQAAAAPGGCWQQQHAGIPSLRPAWWSPGAGAHKLQRWFGLDLFVLLQPASYSRRFLDAAESSSLLSVGRLALSSSGVGWPLLLPVHDALRDAYVGCAQVAGASVALTTDSVHISRLPRQVTAPDAQLRLFAEQLLPHSPDAAAACLAAVGHGGEPPAAGIWHDGAVGGPQQQQAHGVWMSACSTFSLPDASCDHWLQQALGSDGAAAADAQQQQQHVLPPVPDEHQLLQQPSLDDDDLAALDDWDADAAWHPWAQFLNPVHALELDVVWGDRRLAVAGDAADHPSSTAAATAAARQAGQAQEQQQQQQLGLSCDGQARLLADPSAADVWLLHVLAHGFSSEPSRPGRLGVRSVERHRRHVHVSAAGSDWLWTCEAAQATLACGGRLSGVCPQPWGAPPPPAASSANQLDPGSFTAMLSALLTARTAASAARSLWELAGADWWEGRGELAAPPLPPDSVLDSVLRDLLSPPRPATGGAAADGCSSTAGSAAAAGDSSSSSQQGLLPRSAPAHSLLCRLALHALLFGNARAVAALWQRFMVQVRLQFWEQRTLLPYLPSGPSVASSSRRGSSSSSGAAGTGADACGGPPAPDLDACLLHQKLQMLNACIWRRDRRLGRGAASSRQRRLASTHSSRDASSSNLSGGSGSSSSRDMAALDCEGGVPVARSSSSRASGLATAASSTFFSVSGDDQEDAEQRQQEAVGGDLLEAAATALPGDDAGDDDDGGSNDDADCAAAAPSADEEQQHCEPAGVAGVLPGQFLLQRPDRPLRVPVVQDEPVFTEDQLIQRQAALMQLSMAAAASGGAAPAPADCQSKLLLKQRLLAAPLLSDMSAFKAANLGCCFQDFLRWYSLKDWQQQAAAAAAAPGPPAGSPHIVPRSDQHGAPCADVSSSSSQDSVSPSSAALLAADAVAAPGGSTGNATIGEASARMAAARGNDWHQLWALAEPLPAAAQKPLLDPQKEGEQVLHYLETLSPAALFSQLLAAAVTEALSLLRASRGAALPAAAAVVDRFRAMASGVLRKGGGFSEALAAAAAAEPQGREQQQPAHELVAGDWQGAEEGLADVELELLLAEFSYVEQVVVLGESLLHHLPGQPQLAARLLQHLLHGCGSSSSTTGASSSAAEAERAALGTSSRLPVAALAPDERAALLRWVGMLSGDDEGPTLHDLHDRPEDAVGAEAAAPEQQQQQLAVARMQHVLGAPVQQEWVTTCGPIATPASGSSSSSAAGGGVPRRQLAPAVAAAVAAGSSLCSRPAVLPPSRLYLQEADGEMRIAAVLVGALGM